MIIMRYCSTKRGMARHSAAPRYGDGALSLRPKNNRKTVDSATTSPTPTSCHRIQRFGDALFEILQTYELKG